MLGTKLLFISVLAYASGQGASYFSSSIQTQSRLPPRPLSYKPGYAGQNPVYNPQPVYQAPTAQLPEPLVPELQGPLESKPPLRPAQLTYGPLIPHPPVYDPEAESSTPEITTEAVVIIKENSTSPSQIVYPGSASKSVEPFMQSSRQSLVIEEHTSEPVTTFPNTIAKARERTLIMIKPDGVQRGIVGEIITRFEKKGLKLVALKQVWASEQLIQQHYPDSTASPNFPGLVKYMTSGPVVPMVWEGLNAVKTGRVMLGATNPADSAPGTIRGDLCIQVGRNIVHGSDSVGSANKEISLWFTEKEIVSWTPTNENWVYDKNMAV